MGVAGTRSVPPVPATSAQQQKLQLLPPPAEVQPGVQIDQLVMVGEDMISEIATSTSKSNMSTSVASVTSPAVVMVDIFSPIRSSVARQKQSHFVAPPDVLRSTVAEQDQYDGNAPATARAAGRYGSVAVDAADRLGLRGPNDEARREPARGEVLHTW